MILLKNKIEPYTGSFFLFFHAYFAFPFMKGVDYNMKNNIMEYATAFATLSAGVLMLSLAKTYDAKAAAKAIKEVKKIL